MGYKIYIVDAFTTKLFGGNPAGVVISESALSEELMQSIATEVNASETVFVRINQALPRIFHTRFFTPLTEVDLCGHATIAAFYVLAAEGFIDEQSSRFHVKQQTLQEELDVEIIKTDKDIEIVMQQNMPSLFPREIDINRLSGILGLDQKQIGISRHNGFKGFLKPTIASTGLKDLMVPIKTLDGLTGIRVQEEQLTEYSKELGIVGIHAFTLETLRNNTAHCRNFAPLVGISEEAATGTASGALSYYLLKNRYVQLDRNNEARLSFEQGDGMGRPSEIRCYVKKEPEGCRIRVAGTARICIKGEVLLPE